MCEKCKAMKTSIPKLAASTYWYFTDVDYEGDVYELRTRVHIRGQKKEYYTELRTPRRTWCFWRDERIPAPVVRAAELAVKKTHNS